MFVQLSPNQIEKMFKSLENVDDSELYDMSYPTYVNANPIVRRLFWQRYKTIFKLAVSKTEINNSLEFGCGMGLFLPTLRAITHGKLCAVDLTPKTAMYVADKHNLDVEFANSLEQIEDNSLDLIVAADVLEHIEDLEKYIKLFIEKMRKNGILLVSGPTENIWYKIGRHLVNILSSTKDVYKSDYHVRNIYDIEKMVGKEMQINRRIRLPHAALPQLFCVFEATKI